MTDRTGNPLRWQLTAGQRQESPVATTLLAETLERLWPAAVAGDKAYSTTEIRNWLLTRQIAPVIPRRRDERNPDDLDQDAYRDRSVIELAINRLKRFRRIATRYEKLVESFSAMITVATILEWV